MLVFSEAEQIWSWTDRSSFIHSFWRLI